MGVTLRGNRFALLLLLLTATAQARAQQPISMDEAAKRAEAAFNQSGQTGMVWVLVRGREAKVIGFGETAPGSRVKPDVRSLVRLCSLSKIFTGDLLMRLSSAGKVRLDDPLQQYAPLGRRVPRGPRGGQITLIELATHTSGLAREVAAYPPKTPHFTFPDWKTRWDWLKHQRLTTAPGTAALYSNVGFDLLGDALAKAANRSYVQLLDEQLLRPLKLRDTTLDPTKEQCARLLRGNRDEGPCTPTLTSGASGGIYSTPADMVGVLDYLLHIEGTLPQPKGALAVYKRPAGLKSIEGLSHGGEPSGIGAGWVERTGPASPWEEMEKTGGGAGFMTYLALDPSHRTGLFFAGTEGAGHSQVDLFDAANDLLAALAGVPPLPSKPRRVAVARRRKQHAPHRPRQRPAPSRHPRIR